jgi:hypothetical protein
VFARNVADRHQIASAVGIETEEFSVFIEDRIDGADQFGLIGKTVEAGDDRFFMRDGDVETDQVSRLAVDKGF